MVDVHGPSSCFEECQRFLNLYTQAGVERTASVRRRACALGVEWREMKTALRRCFLAKIGASAYAQSYGTIAQVTLCRNNNK